MKNYEARIWLGAVLPACLIVAVVVNIATGKVYVPQRVGASVFDASTKLWVVVGAVALKLGITGSLFSWFFLADVDRTEHVALPSLLASLILAGIGLVVFCVGFFV